MHTQFLSHWSLLPNVFSTSICTGTPGFPFCMFQLSLLVLLQDWRWCQLQKKRCIFFCGSHRKMSVMGLGMGACCSCLLLAWFRGACVADEVQGAFHKLIKHARLNGSFIHFQLTHQSNIYGTSTVCWALFQVLGDTNKQVKTTCPCEAYSVVLTGDSKT